MIDSNSVLIIPFPACIQTSVDLQEIRIAVMRNKQATEIQNEWENADGCKNYACDYDNLFHLKIERGVDVMHGQAVHNGQTQSTGETT